MPALDATLVITELRRLLDEANYNLAIARALANVPQSDDIEDEETT